MCAHENVYTVETIGRTSKAFNSRYITCSARTRSGLIADNDDYNVSRHDVRQRRVIGTIFPLVYMRVENYSPIRTFFLHGENIVYVYITSKIAAAAN